MPFEPLPGDLKVMGVSPFQPLPEHLHTRLC
jgi:hypothetical protein